MKINKEYVWYYDLEKIDTESDAFKKGYIAQILVRGLMNDLKDIGFETIYEYLPALTIPLQIREFWEWYFSLPDVKVKYEHINQKPATGFRSPVKSWFIKK
mgnify:CR=1 FL=1